MGKIYINFKSSFGVETVDEFNTRKEAYKMLLEYRLIGGGVYYLSQRCCKGWC